jgi:hypothetical protein
MENSNTRSIRESFNGSEQERKTGKETLRQESSINNVK